MIHLKRFGVGLLFVLLACAFTCGLRELLIKYPTIFFSCFGVAFAYVMGGLLLDK